MMRTKMMKTLILVGKLRMTIMMIMSDHLGHVASLFSLFGVLMPKGGEVVL
jgi:hypothetical protein